MQALTANLMETHFWEGRERKEEGAPWAEGNDDELVDGTGDTQAVGRHGG